MFLICLKCFGIFKSINTGSQGSKKPETLLAQRARKDTASVNTGAYSIVQASGIPTTSQIHRTIEICSNPLMGLYRGSIAALEKNQTICWIAIGFVSGFLSFSWFLIIPKWPIKAWGHIAILCVAFAKLSKNRPNMDPRTSYLLPKCVKKSRNPWISFKKIYL